MADFSSWGPTDDGRIKPDLVGNGMFLLSAWGDTPYYAVAAGTSMSAPNVTGSLLLLQELYNPSPTPTGYAPDMMKFDGSTGYYNILTPTTSGNKFTILMSFKVDSFTGTSKLYQLMSMLSPSGYVRCGIQIHSSDHANTNRRSKIHVYVQDATGTLLSRFQSVSLMADGQRHVMMISYDGDTGTAIMNIDGVDEIDTGNPDYTAPAVGTLPSGTSSVLYFGSNQITSNFTSGEIGYFGYRDVYLTNWSNFMDANGTPKELDESTWTEWGAQPLFWNADGDMEVNAGSAGNMTKTGSVTPVIYWPPYSTDNFMRAATLKALAIHTADEAGAADGPDYEFGWGLLNTKAAAEVITDDGGGAHQIIEGNLLNGAVDSIEITVTEADAIITATLAWTDPPGTPVAPSLDPPDIMLVNDLDLRVKSGPSTYMPWVLNPAFPADAAATGDNFRDNVEQVVVDGGGTGSYFFEVSHKGTLLNTDNQPYSLIISVEPAPPDSSTLFVDENFSGGLPPGWSVETVSGIPWTINTPIPGDSRLDNLTGGQGNFAMVDNNYSNNTLTSLKLPTFDLSTAVAVVLRFKSYFMFDTLESANVDVSTDGGNSWSNVWKLQGFVPGPSSYVLDLTGPAAGHANVSLRFRYDSEGQTQGNLWQVDDVELEVFDNGPPPGDPPGQATTPNPADGSAGLGINATLSWTAGTLVTSHDVYFGTSSTLAAGDLQGNQAGTSFDPGTLTNDTTYYWRIDEVNGDGTTEGNTWSFTTEAAPPAQTINLVGLGGSMIPGSRGRWTAEVEISVENEGDLSEPGVTVEGNWSNGATGSSTCITGSGGTCSVTKNNLKSRVASVTFTVTNLIKTGMSYNPADNVGGDSITVNQSDVDQTPSASNDSYQTDIDVPVSGNVIGNDDQGDGPASINSNTLPSDGNLSLASNGAFTYTPNALFEGTDSFTYSIVDQDGDISNTATVSITVSGTEPPPTGELSVSTRPFKVKGVQHVEVTWLNFAGATVAISRDGNAIQGSPTGNDGSHEDNIGVKGGGSYIYEVCETGTSNCASASATF